MKRPCDTCGVTACAAGRGAAGSSVKDIGFGCASTGRLCLLLHAGWITSIGCFDICG